MSCVSDAIGEHTNDSPVHHLYTILGTGVRPVALVDTRACGISVFATANGAVRTIATDMECIPSDTMPILEDPDTLFEAVDAVKSHALLHSAPETMDMRGKIIMTNTEDRGWSSA